MLFSPKVFEDVHLSSRPTLESALETLNYFFAFIFALEFALKIIGLGMAVSYTHLTLPTKLEV